MSKVISFLNNKVTNTVLASLASLVAVLAFLLSVSGFLNINVKGFFSGQLESTNPSEYVYTGRYQILYPIPKNKWNDYGFSISYEDYITVITDLDGRDNLKEINLGSIKKIEEELEIINRQIFDLKEILHDNPNEFWVKPYLSMLYFASGNNWLANKVIQNFSELNIKKIITLRRKFPF